MPESPDHMSSQEHIMKSANQPSITLEPHRKSWSVLLTAQQGDYSAFAELYNMYTASIYRYLISRTRHPSLAEDLTSETFLRALRSIDSVRYTGSDVGAWLTTIARNLLFDHLKSSSRREVAAVTFTDSVSYDTPEDVALRDEECHRLRACLAQLTNDQRRCLELRYWLGRSLAETAIELQRDVNSVKALQHRAVRKLAALLDETNN